MTQVPGATTLRLPLARTGAWALLVAGWVGLGSLALQFAPTLWQGFALVALWLLALGAMAAVATRGGMRRSLRAWALLGAAAATTAGLLASVRGSGLPALWLALVGWAALTALASGVVRALRLTHASAPRPPVAAAALGALGAGLVLGDPGDLPALAYRLAALVGVVAAALWWLQHGLDERARAPGCRAGLFDCSLPAWPAGAWRDLAQWPTLLAGLAMLPMMAALPLMAAWCRAQGIAPQAMVLLHLGAMFAPALLLRGAIARWPTARLSFVCMALLVAGGAAAAWAPPPWHLLILAGAHGAAWSLAWSGQLWAPARRGQAGASPLRAAAGYALLTLLFGVAVEWAGAGAVAGVHIALGGAAALGWLGWLAWLGWSAWLAHRSGDHAPVNQVADSASG